MFWLRAYSVVVGLLMAVMPSARAGPHHVEGLISSSSPEENVPGTGGRAYAPGNQNEPLTANRLGANGMLVIEIEGDKLTGQFIDIDGKTHDVFHVRKVVT
jgi:hypothetical protein